MSAKYENLGSAGSPTSPTSPNEWATSDNAPLLMGETTSEEGERTEDTPEAEPQKSSNIAEFKITVSHFLVSGEH
jgi:hypothetical protein